MTCRPGRSRAAATRVLNRVTLVESPTTTSSASTPTSGASRRATRVERDVQPAVFQDADEARAPLPAYDLGDAVGHGAGQRPQRVAAQVDHAVGQVEELPPGGEGAPSIELDGVVPGERHGTRVGQPPLTSWVLIASSRICAVVNGNVTHFSLLNSLVWSAEKGEVGSVDCE